MNQIQSTCVISNTDYSNQYIDQIKSLEFESKEVDYRLLS